MEVLTLSLPEGREVLSVFGFEEEARACVEPGLSEALAHQGDRPWGELISVLFGPCGNVDGWPSIRPGTDGQWSGRSHGPHKPTGVHIRPHGGHVRAPSSATQEDLLLGPKTRFLRARLVHKISSTRADGNHSMEGAFEVDPKEKRRFLCQKATTWRRKSRTF